MANHKNITVIPATINPATRLPNSVIQFRRVAAYARVSTDSEEQLTSYEAQVDYYTRYIHSKEDVCLEDFVDDADDMDHFERSMRAFCVAGSELYDTPLTVYECNYIEDG